MLNVAIEVSGKDKGQKDYTEETQPVLDAQGAVMPVCRQNFIALRNQWSTT